ncbi:PREDICTED: 1-phosphatidylinositol 4,5-bisphosphate phosphodiesterase classes I and II [Nicrophorus vespilloides]|uniref:1-phosphatidylinositol 4,5-bisphosphate phosphodiesterase n=1 Tax=Nicrophorus vespilloides TaxID=110193 RepID=A0ABM1MAC5_NICVS|nr:PREDICTED: 1-phosphatidylinositol 4,5-bisphosphate phosphodiesterase classes I and II [Nicrophorus vespilloides]
MSGRTSTSSGSAAAAAAAAASSSSTGPWGAAAGNAVSLRSLEVPQPLQDGEKFIKWDEDSGVGTPVTLRVDENGFYLHWLDQNKEFDLLDIATIRDTRTGKYAKIPKDPKLRQIVTMGSQDTLEEKTVTVCVASDFVNINFINFCCTRKEIARLWTDSLMSLAYNLNQINGTNNMFLRKAFTKLKLYATIGGGKITVKNVIKMYAQNKEDRKRVEKALELSGIAHGKNDTISTEKLGYDAFFGFYKSLTQRTEVERIFNEIACKKQQMTAEQLVEFLNKTQRDPRLNEILFPYADVARAKDIIAQYEPNKGYVQKGVLSAEGFLKYLMSEDNNIISQNSYDLTDEMDHPMSHYFINSSHNTYLTGHQLTGRSSVEIYRQCLLAGCRCVELDFWNGGRNDEPIIVHGYTFVPDINAREVLEAIAESAFKTSDFPVVLSFENHCNPKQQAKIANYCREIFGDMLLADPIDSHKLEPGISLPPPSMLKRKIIIKNKKKHHHHHHHHKKVQEAVVVAAPTALDTNANVRTGNGEVPPAHPPPLQTRQGSKESTGTEEEDSSSEEEVDGGEPEPPSESQENVGEKAVAAKETEAGAEISALVNYVQPVHFSSFENAEKKNRSYEMSSFDEKQATTLLKEKPIEFVNYNKHQLSRVYPVGTRFDSSNFMPQVFWNAGCQLVALNFQTLDLAMQLNLGVFEYNLRCGFLLKPEFMRRIDRRLDPFAESTVDGIIAGTVKITVISGQFLTDRRVGTYVEVDMYGLPADTARKKFRTKVVPNNGINPVYEDEPFVFKKVVLPELASVRIAVYEESGKFIGHRVMPVIGLCPGYRHVNLRTELGQPLPLATLFLHIVVKDYVPDGLSDFAEALANPIKYQSDLEKRAEQLAVLTEGMEIAENIEPKTNTITKITKEQVNGSPIQRQSITKNVAVSLEANAEQSTDAVSVSVSPNLNTSGSADPPNSVAKTPDVAERIEDIVAEPLEKILENKLVKEKRMELEKKLESLRKKHEKKRVILQSQKSSDFGGGEKRSKLINIKLVKRLSSKNIVGGVFSTESPSAEPLTTVADGADSSGEGDGRPTLPRSQSERLLAASREFVAQEKELREKYHEAIYNTAEKVMKTSQTNQIKILVTQCERETGEMMKRLQADRREEVRALSKIHRDRDELVRVKREVNCAVVDRGVIERERLAKVFDAKKDELTRQHESVRNAFQEHRTKAKAALGKEFETRMARVEGETPAT